MKSPLPEVKYKSTMLARALTSQASMLCKSATCRVQLPSTKPFALTRLAVPQLARRDFAAKAEVKHQEVVPETSLELPFKPFEEVKEELQIVEEAELGQSGMDNSFARLGFHRESEKAINEQINIEYNQSYVYHQLSSYFNRDNVGLLNILKFFKASSLEERSHAQMLMDYQATRGGRVKLQTIGAPETEFNNEEKGDALHAFELALSLEKLNFAKLRELHEVAEKHNDAQFQDFVEDMLADQAESTKEMADYVAQLRRVGKGLGVYEFDTRIAPRAQEVADEAFQALF